MGHGVKRLAVTDQILFQPLQGQERIAAAGHIDPACQADGQCAKTVVQHQYPRIRRGLLLGQVIEQVLVCGVKGLQRFVLLFGLADQVELGERGFEQGHRAGGSDRWTRMFRGPGALLRAGPSE
ncbi:hypothetical protein D3C84_932520 [compost metagenome]